MAIRRGKIVEVILASAFVDRYISSTDDYREKKDLIIKSLRDNLPEKYTSKFQMNFCLNALDNFALGLNGLYLTVSGLSLESGDSGEVGRGNRVNGLISPMRNQTMEAWAGKNFKTHVGKIYSYAALNLARAIVNDIPEISEASIILVGKIGTFVNKPPYIFCDFKIRKGNHNLIKNKVMNKLFQLVTMENIFDYRKC